MAAIEPGPLKASRRWRCLAAAVLALPLLLGARAHDDPVEQRLLSAHNRERAALALPELRWSAQLARDAQDWASRLAMEGRLRHASGGSGQGENLWIGTARRFAPEAMVDSWAAERAHFRPGTFPHVSRTGDWSDVGHYTQMVWRGTREVGCGIGRGARMDVLVCRYAAPGNVVGHRPF